MKEKFTSDYDYHEELVAIRGFIINKSIRIEGLLDTILISFYFKGNEGKIAEFHDDIMKSMTINLKCKVLKNVLKRLNTENEIAYSLGLLRLLDEIFELRNKVAHWNWTRIWPDGIYFKKGMSEDEMVIDDNEILLFIDDCKEVTNIMTRLLHDIGYF